MLIKNNSHILNNKMSVVSGSQQQVLSNQPNAAGTGVSGATLVKWAPNKPQNDGNPTTLFLDVTGLTSSATTGDIIGNTGGAANANLGQYNGSTATQVLIECLITPLVGDDEIDFYYATESTGAQDSPVTDLTETAILTGTTWTAGTSALVSSPGIGNKYLYATTGGTTPGTYTAGLFKITIFP